MACVAAFNDFNIVSNVVYNYEDSLTNYKSKVNQSIFYVLICILSDQCCHKLS